MMSVLVAGATIAFSGGAVAAAPIPGPTEGEPTRVVVALDAPVGSPDEIERAQTAVLAELPEGTVEAVQRFENLPGLVLTVTEPAALAALDGVAEVTRIDESSGGVGALAEVAAIVHADRAHDAGVTGAGYSVAVLDTGVDSDHPDLAGDLLVADARCFGAVGTAPGIGFCPDGSDRQGGPSAAEDDHGHGTHVAAIITGSGEIGSPGIAPDAEIVPIKVLDHLNRFFDFGEIISALDYILSSPELGVDAINLSLTTTAQFVGPCDHATAWTLLAADAVDALREQGVLTFAAAGNNGSGVTMGAPACLSNVIAVTATNDDDQIASFAQSNSTTDVAAPGVAVLAADLGGGLASRSGTSEATPVATACAVLVMQAGVAGTPDEVETRLEDSDISVTDPTNGLSFPLLDCGPALATTLPGPVPDVALVGGESPVVTWSAPAEDVTVFEVMRARNDAGVWGRWTSVLVEGYSYVDSVLEDGVYAYLVRSLNRVGPGPWVLAGTTVVNHATTAPSAPTLSAPSPSTSNVSITWTDVADETYYTLQRARYRPGAGTWGEWTLDLYGRDITATTSTNVPDGIYAFLLVAHNAVGASEASIAQVVVSNATATPSPPTSVTASVGGSVTVSWTDNADGDDAELYLEVQRAQLIEGVWTNFTPWVVDANSTTFTDPAPAAGHYAYLARAVNAIGASEWSVAELTVPG